LSKLFTPFIEFVKKNTLQIRREIKEGLDIFIESSLVRKEFICQLMCLCDFLALYISKALISKTWSVNPFLHMKLAVNTVSKFTFQKLQKCVSTDTFVFVSLKILLRKVLESLFSYYTFYKFKELATLIVRNSAECIIRIVVFNIWA
jgi:hypothetical protein